MTAEKMREVIELSNIAKKRLVRRKPGPRKPRGKTTLRWPEPLK